MPIVQAHSLTPEIERQIELMSELTGINKSAIVRNAVTRQAQAIQKSEEIVAGFFENGANQHAEVLLMKRDDLQSSTSNLVYEGTPEMEECMKNMIEMEKAERVPDDIGEKEKPLDPNNVYAKNPEAQTLDNLRELLGQMQELLTPQPEVSDRITTPDITEADETPTSNAEAERQVAELQGRMDQERADSQALIDNVAYTNGQDALRTMARIAEAMANIGKPDTGSNIGKSTIPGLDYHSPKLTHIPDRFAHQPLTNSLWDSSGRGGR